MFIKLFAVALLKRIQESQQRRADYWLLHNMTNKDLKDVGISRGEIRGKVYGGQTAKANYLGLLPYQGDLDLAKYIYKPLKRQFIIPINQLTVNKNTQLAD